MNIYNDSKSLTNKYLIYYAIINQNTYKFNSWNKFEIVCWLKNSNRIIFVFVLLINQVKCNLGPWWMWWWLWWWRWCWGCCWWWWWLNITMHSLLFPNLCLGIKIKFIIISIIMCYMYISCEVIAIAILHVLTVHFHE